MSGDLTVSGGGSTAVAIDALFVDAARLGAAIAVISDWIDRAAVIRRGLHALDLDVPAVIGAAGSPTLDLAFAGMCLDQALDRARWLRSSLLEAAERYGATERFVDGLWRLGAFIGAPWLGFHAPVLLTGGLVAAGWAVGRLVGLARRRLGVDAARGLARRPPRAALRPRLRPTGAGRRRSRRRGGRRCRARPLRQVARNGGRGTRERLAHARGRRAARGRRQPRARRRPGAGGTGRLRARAGARRRTWRPARRTTRARGRGAPDGRGIRARNGGRRPRAASASWPIGCRRATTGRRSGSSGTARRTTRAGSSTSAERSTSDSSPASSPRT